MLSLRISCLLSLLIYQYKIDNVSASSAAGTETLVAVVGQDFVMIGADTASVQSIVLTSSDMDKIKVVADPFLDEIVGDVTRKRNILPPIANDIFIFGYL